VGYKVEFPKDLQNSIFYNAIILGDIDYWANAWFPNHDGYITKKFYEKVQKIGYIVKAGGLQGYMASKDAIEKYNIKSLEDFKRDEVKKTFDRNKDGKADLIACSPGWPCLDITKHHIKVYGLKQHINLVSTSSYEASLASAMGAFKNGEHILLYTWLPNWIIFKLKPGKDVMWINVAEIIPQNPKERR